VTLPLRVGIVNYLNSRPLAWSFLCGTAGEGIETRFLPPAQVADLLAAGDLDVGLIPSIEVQRISGLRVLPGLCVAATREVRSVLLLSRGSAHQIKRLALDENSRTSAALVRILLRKRYGIDPECVSAPPDLDTMMAKADAALVIGDPALQVDRSGLQVHDLAAEWHRLTDRPFVFAVWALRDGVDLGSQEGVFRRSLEQGLAEMDHLVEAAAAELNLDSAAIREYLTGCLSFELGQAEKEGLNEFYRLAYDQGLLDRWQPLVIHGCCDDAGDSVE